MSLFAVDTPGARLQMLAVDDGDQLKVARAP
jgi:hypothetical protein